MASCLGQETQTFFAKFQVIRGGTLGTTAEHLEQQGDLGILI